VSATEKAKANIRRWRADPIAFVREVLRVDDPEAWQQEVLSAAPHHQRICLKGSKGIGKSTAYAWLAWWFLMTRTHPKVVATSISGNNLRDGLWTEMAKWQHRSEMLKRAFTWNAERIVANDHPETWWMSARQWSQSADPNQQADTLAGNHADSVAFVIEEAGGIPDGVVAAAEAGLSSGGDTHLWMNGNPTQLSGPLYRACTKERHLWRLFEVNGDPDNPKRSGRVDVQWARQQIEKYGADNPWVLVNVYGQFPPGQSNALMGLDVVEAAARKTLTDAEWVFAPKVMGVDVARFGDDRSVIQPRQGKAAMVPQVFRNLDTMQLAGQVAMAIDKWKPDAVFIDVDGVGGGVVDRLKDLGHDVTGIHFGSKPLRAEPKCNNRRTEMWMQLGEWIREGGCIPNSAELISELTAPTYDFDARGNIRMESKEQLKDRGLPSPDLADALALTFAMPVMAKAQTQTSTNTAEHRARQDYDPYNTEARG
jgi:phage terminase large subunit